MIRTLEACKCWAKLD